MTTLDRPIRHRRLAAAASSLVLVLVLAACGSNHADGAGPSEQTATSTSTSVGSTTTTSPRSTTTRASGGGAPVDGPADAVELTCDGTSASLATELVATRPDGIHLTVHNTSETKVSVNVGDRGHLVPPGTTTTVEDLRPRPLEVSCGYDENRRIVPAGAVEVVDPAGNWIPTDIDCTTLPLARWEEPMGRGSTPEEAVRWWPANRPQDLVTPIVADDEIAVVGYPDAQVRRYVSRHDGRDTNIFQLTRDAGTWHALPHENCPR